MKKGNPIALLPIGVFLVIYLGLGLLFEYGLKIPMGFYNIPIVIAFLVAILVACLQNKALSFDKKLEIMGQGVGDKNIITMLLIFLTAGAFVGVVGRSSAQSVAYFMLSLIPAQFAVAVLFVVACFVSTAMGTSVGTITLITPIAVVGLFYTVGFAPLCCRKAWLGYLVVTGLLVIPSVFDIFWRGEPELVLSMFILRLPMHWIACWTYQKADTVWAPLATLSVFNLVTSVICVFFP